MLDKVFARYDSERRLYAFSECRICPFMGLCRMWLSQGIETEGAGSLLL